MADGPIRRPCENCGGTSWVHTTPGERKSGLARVVVAADGALRFAASAGTPVDVYACDGCGLVRLFLVRAGK